MLPMWHWFLYNYMRYDRYEMQKLETKASVGGHT